MRLPFFNKRKKSSLKIEVVSGTDVGLKRENNEDSCLAISGSESPGGSDSLMIVADGMGGLAAGEVASGMAIESIHRQLTEQGEDTTLPTGGYAELLGQILRNANSEICQAGLVNDRGMMGTTCTVAVKVGNDLHIAHVGDSRAYMVRGGNLSQITTDDSWVEEQVMAGNLTREQARIHPNRNIVTQALGVKPDADVETSTVILRGGEQFLLCSDGLHGLLTDGEIESIICSNRPGEARDILIEKAREMGGHDNITVVVGKISN